MAMGKALSLTLRLVERLIYVRNKYAKKEAKNHPADTLGTDGRVQQSDETFDSISRKSKHNQSE